MITIDAKNKRVIIPNDGCDGFQLYSFLETNPKFLEWTFTSKCCKNYEKRESTKK